MIERYYFFYKFEEEIKIKRVQSICNIVNGQNIDIVTEYARVIDNSSFSQEVNVY